MRRALLMADQHVMNAFAFILAQRVVGRQDRPAGIAEHHVHAFFDQTFPDDFSASQDHVGTPNLGIRRQSPRAVSWILTGVSQLCLSAALPLVMAKNCSWIAFVIGPREPLPITILSIDRIGVISAAVPAKKISSATYSISREIVCE